MGEMPTCHACSHFAIARGELGSGKAVPHISNAKNEMGHAKKPASTSPIIVASWPCLLWLGRVGKTRGILQLFLMWHALGTSEAWSSYILRGPEQSQAQRLLPSIRVLEPYGILVDVFLSNSPDPLMDARRQLIEPYLRHSGFYYASRIKSFQYDNPLISAFVER
ncbi:hypothetical protein PIB30_058161 [Stylosanthes scabra]|uniref:Uncharacterized protein n=1 Tax=Stylosanthes scabra TaxID=79078 RepID=A0ABU6QLM9_9FABA|nr:hypothetical protein [Stylosanthes scabra]